MCIIIQSSYSSLSVASLSSPSVASASETFPSRKSPLRFSHTAVPLIQPTSLSYPSSAMRMDCWTKIEVMAGYHFKGLLHTNHFNNLSDIMLTRSGAVVGCIRNN